VVRLGGVVGGLRMRGWCWFGDVKLEGCGGATPFRVCGCNGSVHGGRWLAFWKCFGGDM